MRSSVESNFETHVRQRYRFVKEGIEKMSTNLSLKVNILKIGRDRGNESHLSGIRVIPPLKMDQLLQQAKYVELKSKNGVPNEIQSVFQQFLRII